MPHRYVNTLGDGELVERSSMVSERRPERRFAKLRIAEARAPDAFSPGF
jgi:hypothetical protein